MRPYERVQVVNVNKKRGGLETCLIAGEAGSGVVQFSGAGARLGAAADLVILMTYGDSDEAELTADFAPRVVFVEGPKRIT